MNGAQPEQSVEIQDAEIDLKKLAREDQESYADRAGETAAHTGPAHSALERSKVGPWQRDLSSLGTSFPSSTC